MIQIYIQANGAKAARQTPHSEAPTRWLEGRAKQHSKGPDGPSDDDDDEDEDEEGARLHNHRW